MNIKLINVIKKAAIVARCSLLAARPKSKQKTQTKTRSNSNSSSNNNDNNEM